MIRMNYRLFNVLWILLFSLLLTFLCWHAVAQAEKKAPSPVGEWQTIDDKSHKPKSIVQIWIDKGILYGKIVKGYKENIENPEDFCSKCTGDLKNKPMIGLVILSGLKKESDNSWDDGQIVDPETGNVYSCTVVLSPDGQKLTVRGYIGFSLLGRSQTWLKVKSNSL